MKDCTVVADGPFAGYHRRCGGLECRCEPLPAADPWIKIEPGCEMPEPGLPVLLAAAGHYIVAWWAGNHWRDHMGRLNGSPTHYAVMRTPEAND